MSKKIRIKDIAKMAQVSEGTVDRVIHGRGEVAEVAYKKVMTILEETGYKPNLIARTLVSGKSRTIAVLIPDPGQDEYWNFSYQGAQQAEKEWAQFGIHIDFFLFDLYDKKSFPAKADLALRSRPNGILLAPIFHEESATLLKACHESAIPLVLFNNKIESNASFGFIGQDLYQSGRVGAELLHSQPSPADYAILHIYDDIHNSAHLAEKERGFRDYFLELNDNRINILSVDLNLEHEITLVKELNELLSNPQLKGLLVTTSKGASVVSNILDKNGKHGLKLVAYDLLKENIMYLKKGTIDFIINQNSKRQAAVGISQLVNHLLFKKEIISTHLFPLEIITSQNLNSYLMAENI
jgi:LacI family transcriptional regulator